MWRCGGVQYRPLWRLPPGLAAGLIREEPESSNRRRARVKAFFLKTSVVKKTNEKPLDSHHSEVGRHAHPLHVGATPVAACSSHPRNLPGSRLLGLLMEKPSRVHCFPEPETDFGLRLERLECAVRVIQI